MVSSHADIIVLFVLDLRHLSLRLLAGLQIALVVHYFGRDKANWISSKLQETVETFASFYI